MSPRLSILSIVAILLIAGSSAVQAQSESFVELRNGMRLGPGIVRSTETISENQYEQAGAAESIAKPIGILNDNLRLTYFNYQPKNLLGTQVSNVRPLKIQLPYEAEIETGAGVVSVERVLSVSDFNKYGRRLYSIRSPGNDKHLLQAITEITPLYCKVETLRDSDSVKWDQRIATSSLGSQLLRDILHQQLDLSKPAEWNKVVNFYLLAERFSEAKQAMEEALQKFPNLFERSELERVAQLMVMKVFREIRTRQSAGQHLLASQFLKTFPLDQLPLEVQLQVQNEFESLKQSLAIVSQIAESLQNDLQDLPGAEQEIVKPVVTEILKEVNLDSVNRLADYQRLRNDTSLTIEQRVSLALAGWLLGSGSGLDNFATTKSLIRVRPLVQRYLVEADETKRSQLITQLRSEEAGQPDLVVKLLAQLKPPMTPPPVADDDPPGLHRLQVTMGNGKVDYVVQTPPEYDPNRVYPCVVSLPSLGTNPDYQINWWCGTPGLVQMEQDGPQKKERFGQATANGYIVISPVWAAKGQLQYNYSEPEHARVLKCYRDALRHFSIDTDRVFISGHQAGAAVAWDLALAHPDLWAGGIMISPTADKFIIQYDKNATLVPMYFVWGDKDASGFREQIGKTVSKYLSSTQYDTIGVSYIGREGGFFPEELPRIMEWMELSSHRRLRNPKEIAVSMMRPGDRFFYWLEAPDFNTDNNSFKFDGTDSTGLQAKLSEGNHFYVSQTPARTTWIWLTPELVDFKQPVVVKVKRGSARKFDVSSDLGVILEDARTRTDRLHPFHFRISMP